MGNKKDKPVIKEQPFTYDDYAKLPDDGLRYELADGVLELMSPAPTPKHQIISNQLQTTLTSTCQSEYIIFASPIDLILSPTDVRQPDVLLIHREKLNLITRRGIEGIPDLVVEILSPHSVKRDKQDKQETYAKYGILEYWIFDPANECLEQYVLTGDRYELHMVFAREDRVQSDRFPCVAFKVADIVDPAAEIPG